MRKIKLSKVSVSDLHDFISSRTWGDWKFASYDDETMVIEPTHNVQSPTDVGYAKLVRKEIFAWAKKRGCVPSGPTPLPASTFPAPEDYDHSATIILPSGERVTAFTSDPHRKHWVTSTGQNIFVSHRSGHKVI